MKPSSPRPIPPHHVPPPVSHGAGRDSLRADSDLAVRDRRGATLPQLSRRFPAVNRHFRHHTDATMHALPFALAAVFVGGSMWTLIAALAVRGMRGVA